MQDKWPGEVYSRLLLMGQDYWNSSEAGRGRLGEKKKSFNFVQNRYKLRFGIKSLEKKEWKIT